MTLIWHWCGHCRNWWVPVHYWSFEGLSLSTAPLAWKAAWNSVLVIGSLTLVPPVLYLMWYLRVISYLSVESLHHALEEIIVQPSSIQALLRRIFPSYWLRPVIDLRHLIPCLYWHLIPGPLAGMGFFLRLRSFHLFWARFYEVTKVFS